MKFDANPLIKSAIANPKGNTGKAKEKLTFIDEYLINEWMLSSLGNFILL